MADRLTTREARRALVIAARDGHLDSIIAARVAEGREEGAKAERQRILDKGCPRCGVRCVLCTVIPESQVVYLSDDEPT